ncbi:hypothetical protein [Microbacterium aurum]
MDILRLRAERLRSHRLSAPAETIADAASHMMATQGQEFCTVPCAPEFLAAIGPTANGIVRPILVAGGEIIGVWSHSVAVGKHHLLPQHEVFDAAVDPASVDAALARYARFIRG